MEAIAAAHGLSEKVAAIARYALPAIGFSLSPAKRCRSRFGGAPLLPAGFNWPSYAPRPKLSPDELERLGLPQPPAESSPRALDFLLQIDLAALTGFPLAHPLPKSGLLAFFYDFENQPWGYDPANLGGFRVVYVDDSEPLLETLPPRESAFPARALAFWSTTTLPHYGSRAYDALDAEVGLPESYFDFCAAVERRGYEADAGIHHVLGHAANIQNDMQLEAQLVTHGLYCGDGSGYQDPRRPALEATCEDWILLLQVDSDDTVNMMWGDVGTLFFWIRRQDLAAGRFERCWMTLQCC